MKKLIPLMLGMALMFGAVTTFASPQGSTKATKAKSTKKAKAKATKSN
jgi:hypothetical protein